MTRLKQIVTRVSRVEFLRLQREADALNMTMSEYLRHQLGLKPKRWGQATAANFRAKKKSASTGAATGDPP